MERFVHGEDTRPAANIQNNLIFEEMLVFDDCVLVCPSSCRVFLIPVSGIRKEWAYLQEGTYQHFLVNAFTMLLVRDNTAPELTFA
jgi:hypothetical protein